MRIAYVSMDPGIPAFGAKGGSVHIQAVLRALVTSGHDVTLFTPRVGGSAPAGLESVRVVAPPKTPTDKAHKEERADRERRQHYQNDDLTALLRAAPAFDLVYERHALFAHAAMEFAQAEGIPGVLEVNAPLVEEQLRYRQLHDVEAARRSVTRASGAARVVVTVSDGVARAMEALGVDGDRLHVVPNGVDCARFDVPRGIRAATDPVRIGFLGGLKLWHGVEQLITAFADVSARSGRPVRLVIIGDGPARPDLEAQVAGLRPTAGIEFVGAVSPPDVPGHLASLDVAVAPYPLLDDFYFSPLKLFEYMAAGCAIVASSIGQIPDVLDHGNAGLLYPPGDVPALASALETLRVDDALRERLGAAARTAARQDHDWNAVVARILHLAARSPHRVGHSVQSVRSAC